MNDLTIPEKLDDLDKAIFLVNLSDKAVSATRALLHKIFAEKEWEGRYSSWGEFVEAGLNKSQSWATKQLKVHEFYTLQGGIPTDELELDTERLYLAAALEGSPKENLSKALTLTRRELRESRNDEEETPHEHIPCCAVCRIRL